MEIPTGCTSNVNQLVIENEDIKLYKTQNGTKTIQIGLNVPRAKVFWSGDEFDPNDYENSSQLLSNDFDNNIPGLETPYNQNINNARYLMWKSDSAFYGGCQYICVGCTACNGCYDAKVTSSACDWGCTTGCAEGCTSGCTGGCTTACTSDYAGRRGKNEMGIYTIICKGCNSECNNCTICTACVDDVARMYCYGSTACNGCTNGETGQTRSSSLQDAFDCNTYCQNGLNGLYDGVVYEINGYIVDPSLCYTIVSDFDDCSNLALQCRLFTSKYACEGTYGCTNLNNKVCYGCNGTCETCFGYCAGRCVDACYGQTIS